MFVTLQPTGFRTLNVAAPTKHAIWFAAVANALLLITLSLAHRPELLRMAVCGSAVTMGAVLYVQSPLSYVQFTLWTWFLTPLLRRLIDLRFGFEDQNLVLLAPLLVTALCGLSLKELLVAKINKAPFFLCTAAVLYGLVIGLMLNPSAEVIYGFFNWMVPPVFGLFLYIRWRSYPELKRVIQRTFLYGTIFMGGYAIYQYCAPPKWDVYWWQSLPYGLVAAFGRPFPYQIRVWGSLNAPATFAGVMGISLLLIFASRSRLAIPCGMMGFYAFTLTLSRTEWLGWIVGAIYLASRTTPRVIARSLAVLALIGAISVPLLTIGSANEMVQERLDTFSHLAEDDSVHTRFAMYQHLTGDLLQNPFGHGVSNADLYQGYSLDSGPLRLLYNFGILGTIFYLLGIGMAVVMLVSARKTGDLFPVACTAVLISAVVRLVSVSAFMNVAGIVVWLCVGMGLAAQRFAATAQEGNMA